MLRNFPKMSTLLVYFETESRRASSDIGMEHLCCWVMISKINILAIKKESMNRKFNLTLSRTEYKKKTEQFLRALYVYSIDNFVTF